jgi:hypothetical protein
MKTRLTFRKRFTRPLIVHDPILSHQRYTLPPNLNAVNHVIDGLRNRLNLSKIRSQPMPCWFAIVPLSLADPVLPAVNLEMCPYSMT